jgi:acetoin utilization deacetylase AcuC-like enzyme
MKFIYSDAHRLHAPQAEYHRGEMVAPFDNSQRIDLIRDQLCKIGFPEDKNDDLWNPELVLKIHASDYLEFLETAWEKWLEAGFKGDLMAGNFPVRRMHQRCPSFIDGKAGFYSFGNDTSINRGTWEAAKASCMVAQKAQRLVANGDAAALALCRPPGHHAAKDLFGGYCFLNNAAIAAQLFIDQDPVKVAILDIDFHHGNGTQDIFYDRGDVLFASLHGRPEDSFPYYSGYADETGQGEGVGCNFNYPLPPGTQYGTWAKALEEALGQIKRFGAAALIVSLGVDTYKDDPISFFQLESEHYLHCGNQLSRMNLPTVFVLEGGYALEQIGQNVANVLIGFEG